MTMMTMMTMFTPRRILPDVFYEEVFLISA